MKIDQQIINDYKNSKKLLENKQQEILNIILEDTYKHSNYKYKFEFPSSDYSDLKIKVYDNDSEDDDLYIFKFSFILEDLKYDYSFRNLWGADSKRKDIILIENSFSFINQIINNFEDNKNTIYSLYQEYYPLNDDLKDKKSILEKNEKTVQDYKYSLIFNKIMTLFSKNDKIADSIYEDICSAYYRDEKRQFVLISREFDKVYFRKINIEGKNKSKLSLMYNGSRISKKDLKEQIQSDLILFNGHILNNIQEAVSKLGITDLPLYSESEKINDFRINYNINDFYQFFKKHIIANEF